MAISTTPANDREFCFGSSYNRQFCAISKLDFFCRFKSFSLKSLLYLSTFLDLVRLGLPYYQLYHFLTQFRCSDTKPIPGILTDNKELFLS
jgi:hypothetical protein